MKGILLLAFIGLLQVSQISAITGCCTPLQWTASATTINHIGSIQHTIYYDAQNLRVRWDRVGQITKAGPPQQIITWTDYKNLIDNTPPEWVYFVDEGKCELYGADAFYQWCYGSLSPGQSYGGPVTVAGENCNLWLDAPFTYISDPQCLPVTSWQQGQTTTTFYNSTATVDPSVFSVPSFCHQAKVAAMPKKFQKNSEPLCLAPSPKCL